VSRVNVAIAVAEDARLSIYEIAAACRALGFEHLSTQAEIGVLTGSAELEMLPRIRRVAGVVAVEIAREFHGRRYCAGEVAAQSCPSQRLDRELYGVVLPPRLGRSSTNGNTAAGALGSPTASTRNRYAPGVRCDASAYACT
jgi:hypothetical protein